MTLSVEDLYCEYENWKGWTTFGNYSAFDEEYFTGELAGIYLKGKRILEIGFGNGKFLAWARAQGAEVWGMERSEALSDRASCEGFSIWRESLEKLAVEKPGHFDGIIAFDVLEHIPREDLVTTFRIIKKLLVAGGLFLARFPNGQSPFGRVHQNSDITHITALSIGSIRQLAKMNDLEVVRADNAFRVLGLGRVTRVKNKIRYYLRDILEIAFESLYLIPEVPLDPNVVVVLRKST